MTRRLMPAPVAHVLDVLSTEVLLGSKRVVRVAAQREVFETMWPTEGEGLEMMDLEMMAFAATDAALVDIRAAALVTFEHSAADARLDVSAAPARCDNWGTRWVRFGAGQCVSSAFGVDFLTLR